MSALQSKAKRSRAKPARRVRVLGSRASALRLTKKSAPKRNPLPRQADPPYAQRVSRCRFLRSQLRRIGPGSLYRARPRYAEPSP
jgi:hypothetical protein